MTALDRFLQLQQQGLDDQNIINSLRQEGFQMKDIEDAINQASIKSAVSQEPEQNMQENQQYQESPSPQGQDYAPSYPTPQDNTQYSNYAQESYPTTQDQQQSQEYYGQDYGNYYQDSGITNTETITDIAEQVVTEKTQELTKKIDSLTQTKNNFERDLKEMKENIKRIQENLDTIQKAIIGKIGEFGESTKMVHKDLENLHGTMSKMMNPLIDNYNELKKLNSSKKK